MKKGQVLCPFLPCWVPQVFREGHLYAKLHSSIASNLRERLSVDVGYVLYVNLVAPETESPLSNPAAG